MEIKRLKNKTAIISILDNLPFQPKRAFYIKGMSSEEIRGQHAHKKNRQIITCAKGNCILLIRTISKCIEYILDERHVFLVEPYHWHEMKKFSEDCIILVLASEEYEENDYIRTFEDYIRIHNGIS